MFEVVKGDILESDCQALVNPVNCVGVMGKGLALRFKNRWPQMFDKYQDFCARGQMAPGNLCVWKEEFKHLICLPTKMDWRQPSEYHYIEDGLESLATYLWMEEISSVAIPALGCGLGGLKWEPVLDMMRKFHDEMDPQIRVVVYEPQ